MASPVSEEPSPTQRPSFAWLALMFGVVALLLTVRLGRLRWLVFGLVVLAVAGVWVGQTMKVELKRSRGLLRWMQ